jgi:uncharacterized protein
VERTVRAEIARGLSDFRGHLGQVQSANVADWMAGAMSALVVHSPRTVGLMMLGLGLYKSGFLNGRARRATYLLLIGAGALALMVIGWTALRDLEGQAGSALGWAAMPNSVFSPLGTLGYVAAVVLALKSGAGQAVGRVLAPAGRLAFTNYLTQSLIMTAVFYGGGRGLGLIGRLDWAQWVWIVAAIWVVQLIWSPLWLRHFTMGPFEWVWRRLSLGRDLPLRRTTALERGAVPAA